jgi:hypothetical protein
MSHATVHCRRRRWLHPAAFIAVLTGADGCAGSPGAEQQRVCAGGELTEPAHCILGWEHLRFDLQATSAGSLNQLRLSPGGLQVDNRAVVEELDGTAYRAELADLDRNGWPEVYVFASSAGSGSYGSLVAYAVNNGRSISPIYLPPIEQSPGAHEGYMGHDEFAVAGNRLVRRFPVYRQGDTNAAPGGGARELRYRLAAGEAGWILVLDQVLEYPPLARQPPRVE